MTVSDLIDYLQQFSGEAAVVPTEADAPESGPYIVLDNLLFEAEMEESET